MSQAQGFVSGLGDEDALLGKFTAQTLPEGLSFLEDGVQWWWWWWWGGGYQ